MFSRTDCIPHRDCRDRIVGPHSSYYWNPINSSEAVLVLGRGDTGGGVAPLVVGESGGGVGGESGSLS